MKDSKTEICFVLIFLLVIIGIMIPLRMIMNSGKSVEFNAVYDSDSLLGANTPAIVNVWIFLDGVFVESFNTDEFGIATYVMKSSGDYSFSYNWGGIEGILGDINEALLTQTINLVVDTWEIQNAIFRWNDDSSLMVNEEISVYYEGVFVTTAMTNAQGELDLLGLIVGEWSFDATTTLTIEFTDDALITGLTFYVIPREDSISKLIIRRGIIIIDN